MRLIDADELMELYDGLEDRGFVIPVDAVIQNIKDMPTAYDIDKVVEQLEEMKDKADNYQAASYTRDEINYYTGMEKGFIKAIEIVKSGGIE